MQAAYGSLENGRAVQLLDGIVRSALTCLVQYPGEARLHQVLANTCPHSFLCLLLPHMLSLHFIMFYPSHSCSHPHSLPWLFRWFAMYCCLCWSGGKAFVSR